MEDTPTVNKASADLVLIELQREHDAFLQSADVIDEKAINLLEWASLALAVVSALSMKDLAQARHAIPFIMLGLAGALYLAIVVLSLLALSPRDYDLPVHTDWDTMCDAFLTQSEQDATEQMLSQYIMVIDNNRATILHKSPFVKYGFRLLPALIIALMGMATWPLWQDLFR